MPLAVDTKGSVVANPTTGKTFSRSSGTSASILDDLIGKVKNELAEVREQQTPEEKKEAKQQNTTELQAVTEPAYVTPATTSRISTPPVGTASSIGIERPVFTKEEQDQELEAQGFDPKFGTTESEWEQQRAEEEGREVRTANYWDEQYDDHADDNGLDDLLNMLDPQSKYVGNTATNDAYIRDAMEHGLSEDMAWAISHRNADNGTGIDFGGLADRGLDARVYDNRQPAIDDGTSYDYAHMTSGWMTGPQYMRYVEMGMGGRPIEEIDPTQVYSKWDESQRYNFIPFVPDQYTSNMLVAENITRIPGELGTMVSNLRETATPSYSITYGEGDGTTINGEEFDRRAPAYLNQYYYNLQYHPERLGATVREYAIPDANGQVTYAHGDPTELNANDTLYITYDDGQTVGYTPDEYGSWDVEDGTMMIPDEYVSEHGDISGSSYGFSLTFSDGQTVDISPDYLMSNLDENGTLSLDDPVDVPLSEAQGWLPEDVSSIVTGYENPDLVLSDGTAIPLEDVERIYWDKTPENDEDPVDALRNPISTDDDIRYGFDRFGIGPLSVSNKPRRLMNQEMIDFDNPEDRFDTTDLMDNTVDWTLGSIPISMGTTLPFVYSGSNALTGAYGIEPASYNQATGSRGLMAGGWDENGNLRYGVQDAEGNVDQGESDSTRLWGTLGNAAVPLTEMLVGPVGAQIIPLEKLTKNIPFKSDVTRLLADTIVGAAAEGVEEDLGNVFEEWQQYGPSGMFAKPLTDEYGNVVRDMYGHESRDIDNTSDTDRLVNFFNPNDLANSFLGGAAVSMLMDPLTSPINSQSFVRNIGPAIARDNARRQTGVDRYVETDLERKAREAMEEGGVFNPPEPRTVSPRYLSNFNDDMRGYR